MPVQYDWFSPWAMVSLVQEKPPARLLLWNPTETGNDWRQNANKFGLDPKIGHLNILSEVSIRWPVGNYWEATITLNPTYDEALLLMKLKSKLLVVAETGVEISLMYLTGSVVRTQPFVGIITDLDFTVGQDMSFTLKCVPATIAVAGKDQLTATYKDTRINILKSLYAKYGGGEVNTSEFTDSSSNIYQALFKEVISFSCGGKTAWALILQLLQSLGCRCLMQRSSKTNKEDLVILTTTSIFEKKPQRMFQLYCGSTLGGDKGVFPILGCSTQSKQAFLDNTPVGTSVGKVTAATNKKVTVPVTSGPNAASTVVAGSRGDAGRKQTGVDQSQTDDAVRVAAEVMDASISNGIMLDVDTVFLPDLVPGSAAMVAGLGERVDGVYNLLEVSHIIGSSGSTTKWHGVMLHRAAEMGEKGETNPKKEVQKGGAGKITKTPASGGGGNPSVENTAEQNHAEIVSAFLL